MIGKNWYEEANEVCRTIAVNSGVPLFKVCAVMSALSVNSSWKSNQTNCNTVFTTGEVHHFPKVREQIWKIANCTCPVEILPLFGGLKTRSFYLNLLNPSPSTEIPPITIDRWMLRHLLQTEIVTPKRYKIASERIRAIAKEWDICPIQAQAVLWCQIRGTAV